MGISTEVYTIYGWDIKVNPSLDTYLAEIGYSVPKGVITDMDLNYIYVGAVMFESGDAKWGEMEGKSEFTYFESEEKLNMWMLNNRDFYTKLQVMCPELKKSPKFISWVNHW